MFESNIYEFVITFGCLSIHLRNVIKLSGSPNFERKKTGKFPTII